MILYGHIYNFRNAMAIFDKYRLIISCRISDRVQNKYSNAPTESNFFIHITPHREI